MFVSVLILEPICYTVYPSPVVHEVQKDGQVSKPTSSFLFYGVRQDEDRTGSVKVIKG